MDAFGSVYQTEESTDSPYDSRNFQATYFASETPVDLTQYSPEYSDLVLAHAFGCSSELRPNGQAYNREEYTGCSSVGAQYYNAQGSINDGLFHASPWPVTNDLYAHNLADEGVFFVQPEHSLFLPSEPRHVHHPAPSRSYGGVEGTYLPSYHATNSAHARVKSAALPSRAQSPQASRSQSLREAEPHAPRLQLPAATEHNFVHMNNPFIATDLPKESPIALVPTDGRSGKFPGHPYPDGHQWPQTFKITEVKQIGPKKQTLACFFCRSRKIACTPRPLGGTEDRSCEQCERRGFDCKYPKESKRGQHNRVKSSNAQRGS